MSDCGKMVVVTILLLLAVAVSAQRSSSPEMTVKVPEVPPGITYTRPPFTDPVSSTSLDVLEVAESHLPLSAAVSVQPWPSPSQTTGGSELSQITESNLFTVKPTRALSEAGLAPNTNATELNPPMSKAGSLVIKPSMTIVGATTATESAYSKPLNERTFMKPSMAVIEPTKKSYVQPSMTTIETVVERNMESIIEDETLIESNVTENMTIVEANVTLPELNITEIRQTITMNTTMTEVIMTQPKPMIEPNMTVVEPMIEPTTTVIDTLIEPNMTAVEPMIEPKRTVVEPMMTMVEPTIEPSMTVVKTMTDPNMTVVENVIDQNMFKTTIEQNMTVVENPNMTMIKTMLQPNATMVETMTQPNMTMVETMIQPNVTMVETMIQPNVTMVETMTQPNMTVVETMIQPNVTMMETMLQPNVTMVETILQPNVTMVETMIQPNVTMMETITQPNVTVVETMTQPNVTMVETMTQLSVTMVETITLTMVETMKQPNVTVVTNMIQPTMTMVEAMIQPNMTVVTNMIQPTMTMVEAMIQPNMSEVKASIEQTTTVVESNMSTKANTIKSSSVVVEPNATVNLPNMILTESNQIKVTVTEEEMVVTVSSGNLSEYLIVTVIHHSQLQLETITSVSERSMAGTGPNTGSVLPTLTTATPTDSLFEPTSRTMGEAFIEPNRTQFLLPSTDSSLYLIDSPVVSAVVNDNMNVPLPSPVFTSGHSLHLISQTPSPPSSSTMLLISPSAVLRRSNAISTTSHLIPDLLLPTGVPMYTGNRSTLTEMLLGNNLSTPTPQLPSSQMVDYLLPQEMSTQFVLEPTEPAEIASNPPHITPNFTYYDISAPITTHYLDQLSLEVTTFTQLIQPSLSSERLTPVRQSTIFHPMTDTTPTPGVVVPGYSSFEHRTPEPSPTASYNRASVESARMNATDENMPVMTTEGIQNYLTPSVGAFLEPYSVVSSIAERSLQTREVINGSDLPLLTNMSEPTIAEPMMLLPLTTSYYPMVSPPQITISSNGGMNVTAFHSVQDAVSYTRSLVQQQTAKLSPTPSTAILPTLMDTNTTMHDSVVNTPSPLLQTTPLPLEKSAITDSFTYPSLQPTSPSMQSASVTAVMDYHTSTLDFTTNVPKPNASSFEERMSSTSAKPMNVTASALMEETSSDVAMNPIPSMALPSLSSVMDTTSTSPVQSLTILATTSTTTSLASDNTSTTLTPSNMTSSVVSLSETSFSGTTSGTQQSSSTAGTGSLATPSAVVPFQSLAETLNKTIEEATMAIVPTSIRMVIPSASKQTNSTLLALNLTSSSFHAPSLNVSPSLSSKISAVEQNSSIQLSSGNVNHSTAETTTSSRKRLSTEGRITSSSTGNTSSMITGRLMLEPSTTVPGAVPASVSSAFSTKSFSKSSSSTISISPTPPPCSPFNDYVPPPGSTVSIILAIPPAALSRIVQVGSAERCQLLEALVGVYEVGLVSKEEVGEVRKRSMPGEVVEVQENVSEKSSPHRRQVQMEQIHTAVITDIQEAESIGDNLVDVMFSILDTSDPTTPQAVNSTAVSEAYEIANVNEISGYTVVRQAQPSEDLQVAETPPPDESGPSSRVIVRVIVAAAALATLVVLALLLTLMAILWKHSQRGKFRLQASRPRKTQISLMSRTLVPTNSFEYESQPIIQEERPGSSPHHLLTSSPSPELAANASEGSESPEPHSVTTMTDLAQTHHQIPRMTDSKQESSEPVATTLTHLVHHLSTGSVSIAKRESSPKNEDGRAATEMFERVTHYNSPHLSRRPFPHLPPLKPRFHQTSSLHQSPPPETPLLSPSPTSTFRRIPTPNDATPTKRERDGETSTPRKRKRRKGRHYSTRQWSEPGDDDMMVGLLVEPTVQPESTMNKEEQELWLRRRATMEYHKYISGEESSFHPSFLSFRNQPPPPSTPALPLVVMSPASHAQRDRQVTELVPQGVGSESNGSLILKEVEDLDESDVSSPDSKGTCIHVSQHEEQVEVASEEREKESDNRRTEQKQYRRPRHVLRRHKVAPLTYCTSFTSPVSAGGRTDLAWMDTVNGPQLMSVMPVPIPQPHPQQQIRPPPQYVLPSPQVVTSPVHYFSPTSSQSHHTPHSHLAHSARSNRQQRKNKEKNDGHSFATETDFIDGPEDGEDSREQSHHTADDTPTEPIKEQDGLNGKKETITAPPHDKTADADQHSFTTAERDHSVIQRMIKEAFGTSASQNTTGDAKDGSEGVSKGSKGAFSQTSPQKQHRVSTLPVHVQPMPTATLPGRLQLVWPSAGNQVLEMSSHYYPQHHLFHSYHHSQPQSYPVLPFYGDPLTPSRTSTPHYRTQRPKE